MTLYNTIIETSPNVFETYTLKTKGTMQHNVPERQKAIDYLTKNYGRVVMIKETNKPLAGFIELQEAGQ